MGSAFRNLRHAVRSLMGDKGFTVTVVLTIAVCIAANTATFAVVDSVLLRPLPVPDARSILLMANRYPKAGADFARTGDGYAGLLRGHAYRNAGGAPVRSARRRSRPRSHHRGRAASAPLLAGSQPDRPAHVSSARH